MELKRIAAAEQIPASIDVEIGAIVVEGITIRDPHVLQETVRRALERHLAQARLTSAGAAVESVHAADLRPEHSASDHALGEQIAERVAAAVRT